MTRYQLRDDVQVERVADEIVVLHPDGDISVLNSSASLVLAELGSGFEVGDAAGLLESEYGLEPEQSLADASSLVGQLLSEGVVGVAEARCGEASRVDMSKRAALAALARFPKMLASNGTQAHSSSADAYDSTLADVVLGGWADGSLRVWKDSLGAELLVPRVVRKVAPFGPYAQALLESICPERVVWAGGSGMHASALSALLPDEMKIGHGSEQQARPNLGLLAGVDADLVIEVATTFQQLAIPRGAAQPKSSAPIARVVTGPGSIAQTYRALGSLLGSAKAMSLAEFAQAIEDALAACRADLGERERKRVFFGMGEGGLDTLGRGTLLSSVADSVGLVNAASAMPRSRCKGLSLGDVERLAPDLVLLARGRHDVDGVWSGWDRCPIAIAPDLPYPWLLGNPLVMQTLGALWLGNVAYPECFGYDMAAVTACCFHALFNRDITVHQASAMLQPCREKTDRNSKELS